MLRKELAKRVLEFHRRKAKVIFKETGVAYLLPADEKDILKARKSVLIDFIKGARSVETDGKICFWCFTNRINGESLHCFGCKYGRRHGFCNDDWSDYSRIGAVSDSWNVGIIGLIGKGVIEQWIEELFGEEEWQK